MDNNIKVARAHRALSWLYGLCVVLFSLVFFLPGKEHAPAASYFILIFFGCLFALHHFTAKGARERKHWARNTSRGIAIFMLLGFPVGTLIGIYLLFNSSGWDNATNAQITNA